MDTEKITYDDEDSFLLWRTDGNIHSFRSGYLSVQFDGVTVTDDFIFLYDPTGYRVATMEPDNLERELVSAFKRIHKLQREAV